MNLPGNIVTFLEYLYMVIIVLMTVQAILVALH